MFKNEHSKKLIYFIVVALFIIISLATLITSTINNYDTKSNKDSFVIETQNNWIVTSANTATLTINKNTSSNLLFMYNSCFKYSEIYLGDKLIYTTINDELDSCIYTHWISVDPNISNKLTVKTTNKEALYEITNANSYIGTYNSVINEFISDSIIYVLFVAFCLLIFVILALINLFYRFKNNNVSYFNSNYLGLLILCAGLYILTDSQLLSIFVKNYDFVSILNILSISLFCPFILKYLDRFFSKEYDIINILTIIAYLSLCVILIFYRFRIIRLYQPLFLIHIFIMVCAITIFYLILTEYRISKAQRILIIVIGLISLFIGTILTVVVYYFIPTGLYNIFFTTAIFIFIISLLFALVYTVSSTNKELKEESIKAKNIADKTINELTQFKNEMINGIVQNIKEPINEIVGYTNMALNNNKDSRKYLNIVKENTRILNNVVDDISDIFTIDDNVISYAEKTDILAYFEVVSKNIKDICDKNYITFYSDLINSKHRFINLDKNSIDKAIYHLVSNALKYTDESNSISFILRESDSAVEGYTHLTFSINDDGKGMSDKFKETAFDNFSKENIISKKPIKNSGLELSLTKKLIEKIGGSVILDSANEKGTSIRIEIDAEVTQEQLDFEKYDILNGKKILIVDNDYQNCEIIKSYLTDVNCEVDILNDTSSTIELLSDSKSSLYDAIITEIDMPNISGLEMAKTIRNFGYSKIAYMPIIAMSLSYNIIQYLHDKEKGFNECLIKPINQKELLDKLQKNLNN